MQRLVWGHKGNLKSIDGRSGHKAPAPIDLGHNSGPKESGGETWTRRRLHPARAKVRLDGRLSAAPGALWETQRHPEEHGGVGMWGRVPRVAVFSAIKTETCFLRCNLTPSAGGNVLASSHFSHIDFKISFSSSRSCFLLNPVEPTKHQHENTSGMLEPQCTGGRINWSAGWQKILKMFLFVHVCVPSGPFGKETPLKKSLAASQMQPSEVNVALLLQ